MPYRSWNHVIFFRLLSTVRLLFRWPSFDSCQWITLRGSIIPFIQGIMNLVLRNHASCRVYVMAAGRLWCSSFWPLHAELCETRQSLHTFISDTFFGYVYREWSFPGKRCQHSRWRASLGTKNLIFCLYTDPLPQVNACQAFSPCCESWPHTCKTRPGPAADCRESHNCAGTSTDYLANILHHELEDLASKDVLEEELVPTRKATRAGLLVVFLTLSLRTLQRSHILLAREKIIIEWAKQIHSISFANHSSVSWVQGRCTVVKKQKLGCIHMYVYLSDQRNVVSSLRQWYQYAQNGLEKVNGTVFSEIDKLDWLPGSVWEQSFDGKAALLVRSNYKQLA